MTSQQMHNFLTTRIGQVLEELTIESGLPLEFSSRNCDRIACMIEDYMMLEQVPGVVNEFPVEQNMEADEYE